MRNSGWQNDSVVEVECAKCKTLQVRVDQSKHAKRPIKCEDGDLKTLRIHRFACRSAEGEAQHASTGHKKRKPALVTWLLEFVDDPAVILAGEGTLIEHNGKMYKRLI